MDSSFGDDVGVEAVAEVDRVDVVAVGGACQHLIQQGGEKSGRQTIPDRCT